ncbi:Nucleotide-binding oligomerization domain-containing protein 2 [Frankliniella fusca]|uniref:Nucleotide-binding oligomerization domain-containing protein 2 n=1 Tax=Frankliniella fusca TaxID=407009 RepID=A0AAE1LMS3_9NEOP|nr:Nucleotide-binding oligomerization domain-containing protein 2 [Frankliniella fusca]
MAHTVQFIQNTPINHILKGGSRGDQGSSSSPQDKGLYKNHSMHRSKKKKSHAQHGIRSLQNAYSKMQDRYTLENTT